LLDPGQSEIFPAPGPGQRHVVFVITDSSGRTLGCLSTDLDTNKTVVIRASQKHPC
jgi:hypothetical protein